MLPLGGFKSQRVVALYSNLFYLVLSGPGMSPRAHGGPHVVRQRKGSI